MQLVLDDLEIFAPVVLHGPPMTDDEFLEFCALHEDLRLESNASGEIEIMPPPGPESGEKNAGLNFQLYGWASKDRRGRAFDSSSMFVLPSGARRSPDASWVSLERIATVPRSQKSKLWHICPEFVVELRSPTDRKNLLHQKMLEWIANGVELGWLIDPIDRAGIVYRPGRDPELLNEPSTLIGEGPVAGFVLDLTEIWRDIL